MISGKLTIEDRGAAAQRIVQPEGLRYGRRD